jgi:hypothetical protein
MPCIADLLPPAFQGVYSRFVYDSWDGAGMRWMDVSGNGRHATASGSGFSAQCLTNENGARARTCEVRGTTSSILRFGAGSIPSTFTLCTVSRYAGPMQERIFNGDENWLHGHWKGLSGEVYGHTGVAHYGGWKTNGNNAIPSTPTDWLVFCGQNADPYKFYANGQSVGTDIGGTGGNEMAVNYQALGCCGNEVSDFAIAEVTVWDRALSEAETQSVSSYYLEVLAGTYSRTGAGPEVWVV